MKSMRSEVLMFKFGLVILFFTLNIAYATTSPWLQVDLMRCKSEFLSMSNEKKWHEETFIPQVPGSYKEKVWRNLSNKIGEWVEFHFIPNQSPQVVELSKQTFTRISFDSDCKMKTNVETLPWHLEKYYSINFENIDNWSDEDLLKLVNSNSSGLIYYWSPKFTYSVLELPKMEKLVKSLGIQFIPVVDPRASPSEISTALEVLFKDEKKSKSRSLASNYNVNRNVSLDLYMRNGFNHFPVSYVYANKKMHSRFVTGVMTDGGNAHLVKTYLSELKKGKHE